MTADSQFFRKKFVNFYKHAIQRLVASGITAEQIESLRDFGLMAKDNVTRFVGTSFGEVACLSAKSGNWLWREIINEPIDFQPAVAKGRLFVPTRTGSLYCLDTADARDDGWFMWGGSAAHNGVAEPEY